MKEHDQKHWDKSPTKYTLHHKFGREQHAYQSPEHKIGTYPSKDHAEKAAHEHAKKELESKEKPTFHETGGYKNKTYLAHLDVDKTAHVDDLDPNRYKITEHTKKK